MAGDKSTTSFFAPPIGTMPAPAEPAKLEFETPPLACPDRSAHSDVWRLLALAEHGAAEDERRSAVETLVSIFQQQVAEFACKQRQQIDLPLIRFFERQSLHAIVDADPNKAAKFLVPLKPGKRASPAIAERDLQIAGKIVQLMESGRARDDAIDDAATRWDLSWEHVEKIYERRQGEARVSRHGRI
jgi:hypothetical protein